MISEKEAYIILNALPGLGSVRLHKLIEHFGSAVGVVSSHRKIIFEERLIPPSSAAMFDAFDQDQFLSREMELLQKHGADVVTFNDPGYPHRLKEIPGAPILLYYKGTLSKINELSLAMVGSRQASVYGLGVANELSNRLAELGFSIISGMARGIDTAAHRGCLKANGYTAAVLGCGLTHIYPPENKDLMDAIEENGVLLTEFPMEIPPIAKHFPQRNRVISGLSLGVVVVEAAHNSGALITSHFALEQGREVFAVPGRINHPNASGTHQLIQQGAKLVTCVEDILEELQIPIKSVTARSPVPESVSETTSDHLDSGQLSPEEKLIYTNMDSQAQFIDEIAGRVQKPAIRIMNILLQLEMKKLVKRLPGQFYVRNS